MLKKIVAWPVAQALFWLGHGVSLVFEKWDSTAGVLYPVYNNLMLWSADVDRWGNAGVWDKVNPRDDEKPWHDDPPD